ASALLVAPGASALLGWDEASCAHAASGPPSTEEPQVEAPATVAALPTTPNAPPPSFETSSVATGGTGAPEQPNEDHIASKPARNPQFARALIMVFMITEPPRSSMRARSCVAPCRAANREGSATQSRSRWSPHNCQKSWR